MTPTDLDAICKRVEEASGAGKELDRAIARIAGWHRVEPRHSSNKHGGWISPSDWIGAHSNGTPILDSLHGTDIHRDVPDYTKSLDAAMTLVPEGWWLTLDRYSISDKSIDPFAWRVWLKRLVGDVDGDGPCGLLEKFAKGASPALALCLAALRARTNKDNGNV